MGFHHLHVTSPEMGWWSGYGGSGQESGDEADNLHV